MSDDLATPTAVAHAAWQYIAQYCALSPDHAGAVARCWFDDAFRQAAKAMDAVQVDEELGDLGKILEMKKHGRVMFARVAALREGRGRKL